MSFLVLPDKTFLSFTVGPVNIQSHSNYSG